MATVRCREGLNFLDRGLPAAVKLVQSTSASDPRNSPGRRREVSSGRVKREGSCLNTGGFWIGIDNPLDHHHVHDNDSQ